MEFSGIHYIFSLEIFLIATGFLVFVNWLEKKGSGPYPSIAFIAIGVLYLYYIFTAILLWTFPHVGRDFRERFGYGYEYYLPSMWIGLMAMIFTYLGYRVAFGKKQNPLGSILKLENFIIQNRSALYMTAILFFASHLVIGYMRQKLGLVAGYGSGNVAELQRNRVGNIFNMFYDLSTFAFPFLLYVTYISRKNWMYVVAVVLFGVEVLSAVFAGGILALFGALLPVLVLFLYRGLIPYRADPVRPINLSRFILFSMAGLFFAITMKDLVRSFVNLGFQSNIMGVISNLPVFFSIFEPSAVLNHIVLGFVKEISGADIISLIFHRIENGVQDFRYGATYSYIFVSFIPSLLWPGKPEITQTSWFADNFWFSAAELERIGTGVQGNNFLLPGEAVLNFGYYAVPFEMFIYGAVIGLISKYLLQPRQMYFIGYVLLCRVFFDLIHPATTFAAMISNCVKQTILVLFTLILLKFLIRMFNGFLAILKTPSQSGA